MPKIRYNILSPDGFPIERDKTYPSIKAANRAFDLWAKRFEKQGYYSANDGRIPLNELAQQCGLQILTKEPLFLNYYESLNKTITVIETNNK